MAAPIPTNIYNASQSRPASRPPSRPGTPNHGIQNPHTIQLTAAALMGGGAPTNAPTSTSASTSAPNSLPGPRQPKQLDNEFNFAVPSLPPRLANFGRKISQMGSDFINELDAPYVEPKVQPSKVAGRDEVPGMGDEPVMCPFCEKPLPPALFASHSHTKVPVRPGGLKRSNTTTGVKPAPTRSYPTQATPLPIARTSSGKLMDSLPLLASHSASTSETLLASVTAGESSNIEAAKLVISEEDLDRWSRIAGIQLPPEIAPTPPLEPVIPKIEPPRGRSPADRTTSRSSSRFNFFNSEKPLEEGDESDEDVGGATGYSRLQAGGSDTEDEDKEEILHDEPKSMDMDDSTVRKKTAADDVPSISKEEEAEPAVSPEELQKVIKEVLHKMAEMVRQKSCIQAQTHHPGVFPQITPPLADCASYFAQDRSIQSRHGRGQHRDAGSSIEASSAYAFPSRSQQYCQHRQQCQPYSEHSSICNDRCATYTSQCWSRSHPPVRRTPTTRLAADSSRSYGLVQCPSGKAWLGWLLEERDKEEDSGWIYAS